MGVQLEFSWSEKQYVLPGHVANKISIGALNWSSFCFPSTQQWVMSHFSKYIAERATLLSRRMLTAKFCLGATRNLILRGIHPGITERRIRDDLDHIHNIVVISVALEDGDAYISLNSINNSLFARTCMMSRVTYKGMKIEWYPDECSQPLPKVQYASKNSRQENLAPQPKKNGSAMNRFQMLDLDGNDDDSSETDKDATVLSDFSSR